MMTGIRKVISSIVVCAALVLTTVILIPKTVSAEDHGELQPGTPVKIDLASDRIHWFKFTSTKQQVIQLDSTGTVDVSVEIYKGSKSGPSIADDDNGAHDYYNFMCRCLIDAGTYWIKVIPDSTDVSPNNTAVTLSVLSHEKIADFTSAYFPNTLFRNYVYANFDVIDDGELTYDEMMLVTQIDVDNMNIDNLKGVELFKELEILSCNVCKLSSLNIPNMPKLNYVSCKDNNDKMDSLNVSNCPELIDLDCSYSEVTSLKVSGCDSLEDLTCIGNTDLKSLDVSGLTSLEAIWCAGCQISSLNLNGCTNLEYLDCNSNKLTSLDVSNLPVLDRLFCQGNQLTSLKLNNKLNLLQCYKNKLKNLDLTGLSNLYVLECEQNDLTDLDISSSLWLCSIYPDGWNESRKCYEGEIRYTSCRLKIDPSVKVTKGNSDPSEIVVDIDEEHFPDMNFRIHVCGIFDSDHDDKFSKIEIAAARLLDVSNSGVKTCKGIEYLTELEEFYCNGNSLTELDLTNNTKLTLLSCKNSTIKKLKIDTCTELNSINCFANNLSDLDISKNTKLSVLVCYDNPFASLDIYNCPQLVKAYKEGIKEETDNYVLYLSEDQSKLCCDKSLKIIIEKPTPIPTATATPTPTQIPAADPTVKPADNPSGYPTIVPTAKPTSVPSVTLSLDKTTADVICGKTLALKADIKGTSSEITWKSSDTKVATVDSSGKITAKMAGTVTITATATGKSANCTVTVLYKDVTNPKDFWFEPTNYLTAKGVVKGYDKQTKFKPANKCTRAQMVTFIWRLMGEPAPKAQTCKFSDVKQKDYFYKACIWGNENHIVEGYKNGTFGPQIVCARKHAVTFLWRLADKPQAKTAKNPFKDVKKSDYFYKATLWASEKGILAGYKDGTFRPNGDCLRRQMVTFLYKYDKKIYGRS